MHSPRDAFEQELYGDSNVALLQAIPGWRVLALAAGAYAVPALLLAYAGVADLGGAELQSLSVFGGLMLVLGSGLFAGWLFLAAGSLLSNLRVDAR
jgi:hypothetical protein